MLPEQRLWVAVVTQAVIDATTEPLPAVSFSEWEKKRTLRRQKKGLEPESEIALRAAWITRRKDDAVLKREVILARDEARRWLLSDDEDQELVCQSAGYDAEYIRDQARKLAASGWQSAVAVKFARLAA